MHFDLLPRNANEFMTWTWREFEPYYEDLLNRVIDDENVQAWLSDWSQINDLVSEYYARLNLATTLDTTDLAAEARFNAYLDTIHPKAQSMENQLKQKLVSSGLMPAGFEVSLRKMRTDAAIFCIENLALISEERKLVSEYNKVIGQQSIAWQGEEITLQQLRRLLENPDRELREKLWKIAAECQLADRKAINGLWVKFMDTRKHLAINARFDNYRSFRWLQMLRLDYTPEDCLEFQQAIEQVVVPVTTRLYQKHAKSQGYEKLRPWDLDQDLYPLIFPPLPGFGSEENLANKTEVVFQKIDRRLGDYFRIQRAEQLMDLSNRKGKAPGAYCQALPVTGKPFIFMNAVGVAGDVRTILHESGHAFHNFERLALPYAQQRVPGLEFAEVASMAMELLAFPYLQPYPESFFSPEDYRRFKVQHLKHLLYFLPYMAVVDSFQHWVYTNHTVASSPEYCDLKWQELGMRFLPGLDWSGLDDYASTGWHRKQHIHRYPFYYVEYGLAQLGAVQVWRNSLTDPQSALEKYLHALRLGGTVSLPELYQAAGAKLAFDVNTLSDTVEFLEKEISSLETG